MCWNQPASLALAALGAACAVQQAATRRPNARVFFFAYFAAMELLQAVQYTVIGQCDSQLNQAGERMRGVGRWEGRARAARAARLACARAGGHGGAAGGAGIRIAAD